MWEFVQPVLLLKSLPDRPDSTAFWSFPEPRSKVALLKVDITFYYPGDNTWVTTIGNDL